MPALDLSEKLTKYIRLSIKLSARCFPYTDTTGVCQYRKVPLNSFSAHSPELSFPAASVVES